MGQTGVNRASTPVSSGRQHCRSTRARKRRHWPVVAVAAAGFTALLAASPPALAGTLRVAGPGEHAFVPVPTLRWHACTSPAAPGFQCATAQVPLDYSGPFGRTIRIAVIRHPATQPWHRIGSLFFNPGGPGGSGVGSLPPLYRLFPATVRERFDIVSFDPRGVGQSAAVRCFPSAAAEGSFFGRLPQGFPIGRVQTRDWISGYATLGRLCQQRAGWLLPHIATADVARDMDLLRQAVGDPALNYLGASYGTYLGATYANLFPGHVRALVLDGAVAPMAWARPAQLGRLPLSTFLRVRMDTGQKATLGQFLDLCSQASIRHCAFSAGTAQATRAKYATLLRRLRRHPVVITLPGQGRATLTYPSLTAFVANGMYTVVSSPPFRGWDHIAGVLESAWHASSRVAGPGGAPVLPVPTVPPLAAPGQAGAAAGARYPGMEQQYAIMCADSPNPRTLATYPAQAAFAQTRSGAFGPFVAWLPEACATWPATDASGYDGPWNTWTSNPILVVGTRYDPATPYWGAGALTSELARGRLLTEQGYGHTALLNPSTCINRYESGYFVSGALPPPGTVCHQDHQPFGLPGQP